MNDILARPMSVIPDFATTGSEIVGCRYSTTDYRGKSFQETTLAYWLLVRSLADAGRNVNVAVRPVHIPGAPLL
jgi:hypothetical protein